MTTDAALTARIAAMREELEALRDEHRAAFRRIGQIEERMEVLRGSIIVMEAQIGDAA